MKNKVNLVEKEKEIALKENNSLKRKIVSKEKENISKKKRSVDSHSHHAFHATINQNKIKFLKNRINCLSSTLSNYAFNHPCFKGNKLHMYMHITHDTHMHTLHIMITLTLICILECTNVYIAAAKAI